MKGVTKKGLASAAFFPVNFFVWVMVAALITWLVGGTTGSVIGIISGICGFLITWVYLKKKNVIE